VCAAMATTVRPSNKRGRRSQISSAAVLDVAAEIFAARGFLSTSLELVAERLGVTRQALYYHFKNKSEILAALFDEVMSSLEAAAMSTSAAPGTPRFVAIVKAHARVVAEFPTRATMLLHERPALAEITTIKASNRRRRYTTLLMLAYEEGVDAGLLRARDPAVVVNGILAALNSLPSWARAARLPVSEVADEFASVLSIA
jgi:AcrR family transcriptional regulator